MNRDIFKNMSDQERIAWVRKEYNKGKTTAQIIKEYNLAKNTVGDTFRRNGYVADKNIGQYVLNNSEHVNITQNKHKSNIVEDKKDKHENIFPEEIKENLLQMITWYKEQKEKEEEREQIFDWIKKNMENKDLIEVPEITIDKQQLSGAVKTRSFTIYSDVLQKFNDFCSGQPYSKQNLLSMALLEYIERYKK
ncbi:hypothetical protein OW763_16400 [Clostridium aestuarii]|uniref:DNA-binding protein n=1 Tax=Clostridium aestuarii TaxID=338193 RepID=A0ABT4D3S7_9CLOT|nr:hypothetical protein [Clostridium aestuarii]MCY6485893.1 hypothetical protein [Clostridium aestuarii]